MTQQPAFTVKIAWRCPIGGVPYGLSQYDYSDEIRQMIDQKGFYGSDRSFQLSNTNSASTTFQQVKHLLQEEWGVPLSIQSHFLPYHQVGMSDDAGGPLREFADTDTLGMAWEAAAEDKRQEGTVKVELQTMANYLEQIEGVMGSRGDSQHSLVSAMKGWRHHANALKYLRGKQNSVQGDEEERAVLESKTQEQETLAQRWGQSATKKMSDWYRLVSGHEAEPAEEKDIESRFRKWIDDKIEVQERYREKKRAEAEDQSHDSAFSPNRVVCRSLRDEGSGHISADYGSFNLRSGVLLWGQLPTIFSGSRSEQFQRNAESVPDTLPGGTIKQSVHSYRAAARKGRWTVRRAFTDDAAGNSRDGLDGKPTRHLGWVVSHEDVDPLEVLTRCSSLNPGTGRVHGYDQIDKVGV
ncbi:hypothetical protein N7460_006611 [Penicillium canescens]|uniref:Uncharacterized protein n=1 Tax=Penicillium canescens TaxID=5083 RepID=A0AAD6IG22_PENCN|nr:hypothetical protein N7460_006611 [Penicillium canescens]KAJ6056725.1 hypothetical protein N7444_005823 [Penicillium canescens]